MASLIDLGQDWHSHSTVSDGVDEPLAMCAAAELAGLTAWGLTDHVRADTTWLPDYVRAVRSLRSDRLTIRCAVETKILTIDGRLDLPARLPTLDYVLIADHQVPGVDGPIRPDVIADDLRRGRRSPDDVLAALLEATVAAAKQAPFRPVLAHLFSVLPKCGLTEDEIADDRLSAFALDLAAVNATVEINEKWGCPSGRVAGVLLATGVPLVAGSDAHRAADLGRWSYVAAASA